MSDLDLESRRAIARWKRKMGRGGWVGVDLDGTLAKHGTWRGELFIGPPVPVMVERIKKMRASGVTVKILTARAEKVRATGKPDPKVIKAIRDWCFEYLGERLPVTNEKTYSMIELWDDRAVQVIANTGLRADGKPDQCCYNGRCDECKSILPEEG